MQDEPMVEMTLSDANDLDAVVHALGIEESSTTPAEAVAELHAEIELLRCNIAALTARLAALEQAAPEEVVEMAALALRNQPLLVPGTLFDLLCTTTYANDHVIALLLNDTAVNVVAAIAPTLRAQGAAAERERCAALADSACVGLAANGPDCGCGNGRVPVTAYRHACDAIAARIRAGGSGE
jgi:hypothetical protein